MQFRLAHQPIDFEIPDEWLTEANVLGFVPRTVAYASSSDPEWPTTIVPLFQVAAPVRNPGVEGLHKERAVSILRAVSLEQILTPLKADQPPHTSVFKYRVRNGYHRFYISAALGFSHLPLSVRPYFDINAPSRRG